MIAKAVPALLLLALAGCAATPTVAPGRATLIPPPPRVFPTAGLERVMGQSARSLTALFGKPDADLTEGAARKMQFGSGICVLDAYLYPPQAGSGEPIVSFIDTRQRDGSAIDRASCVAALSRREGGK